MVILYLCSILSCHVICVHMHSFVCFCMVSEHMVFWVYKLCFGVILSVCVCCQVDNNAANLYWSPALAATTLHIWRRGRDHGSSNSRKDWSEQRGVAPICRETWTFLHSEWHNDGREKVSRVFICCWASNIQTPPQFASSGETGRQELRGVGVDAYKAL